MPRKIVPGVKLGAAIEDFIAGLDRGLAPRTVRAKRRTLQHLVKFAPNGERTLTRNLREATFTDALRDLFAGADPHTITSQRLKGVGMRTGRKSASGTRADRTDLRQFARHLRHRGWVPPQWDPLYEITRSTKDTLEPDLTRVRKHRRIPFGEWAGLMDAAAHPRDRLMLALGLWWARRASDLAVLRWGDLDLTVSGEFPYGSVDLYNVKRGRRVAEGQPLPVGPAVRREIDRYLAWFTPRYGQPEADWPLVPAKPTVKEVPPGDLRNQANWPLLWVKGMTPDSITKAVRAVLRAYGWEPEDMLGEGGHTLRRSGLDFYDEMGDLETAQMLADHKHPEQTRAYAGKRRIRARLSQAMLHDPEPDPEPVAELEPEVAQTGDKAAVVIDMFSRQRVA